MSQHTSQSTAYHVVLCPRLMDRSMTLGCTLGRFEVVR